MESEDALERGESGPLLPLNVDSEDGAKQASHLHHKASSSKAPAFILGFNVLDSLAFTGVGANLIVYLQTVLHGDMAANAANVGTWSGTCFLTPLFGAVMADTYWGNYKTIFLSLIVYLLGMLTITSAAFASTSKLSQCEGPSCQAMSGTVFFAGLYLIAVGSGGIKAALLPFGADQFNDENPVERDRKGAFFGWFYLCLTLGALTSGTIIVWIQQNVDWGLGYGIATFCLATGMAAFLLGTPNYRIRTPSGSPLKSILQVVAATYNKRGAEVPRDPGLLYDENKNSSDLGQQRLAHTNEFRFLDKGSTISSADLKNGLPQSSWQLCTVTQVEELKIFFRLLPIWATCAVSASMFAQMFTTFIQQGSMMNNTIGSFSIPPASLCSFEVISVMGFVFIYNSIIFPASKKYVGNGAGFSLLQRMGIGRFFLILGLITAAYNEQKRLEAARAGEVLSIARQLPQFLVFAIAEVFGNIPQLEFFYSQAPDRMKSICTALLLLSMALGNYLNSFIITTVAALTSRGGEPGWIPNDLNKGHLDYLFLILAAISTINLFVHISFANKYTLKKVLTQLKCATGVL